MIKHVAHRENKYRNRSVIVFDWSLDLWVWIQASVLIFDILDPMEPESHSVPFVDSTKLALCQRFVSYGCRRL